MDAIDFTGFVFLAIDYMILCPILIYFFHLFHRTNSRSDSPIHRSATLVYTINIVTLLSVVIEHTFLSCSRVWLLFSIPSWVDYLLISLTSDFLMILFILKVYHIYYKQKYNEAIACMSWRKDINPNDTDWFILHKQTFGNTVHCIKLSIIPYILIVCLQTFVAHFLETEIVYFLLNTSIISVLISMALAIFHKTKSMIDIYGIRDELFYQCLGITVSLILYLSVTLIFLTINSLSKTESISTNNRIEWLLHIPISYIVILSIGLISTIYPIWFHRATDMSYQLSLETFSPSDDGMSEEAKEYIRTSKGMEFIISDHQSFILFMQYLITEFSTENLLFLAELVEVKYAFQQANNNVIRVPRKNLAQPQYYNVFDFVYPSSQSLSVPGMNEKSTDDTPKLRKDAVSSNKNDNSRYVVLDFNPTSSEKQRHNTLYSFLFQTDNIVHTKLSIPSELPKSAILENNDNLLDQMKALYRKYIKSGSSNEINLSFGVRNSVAQFFEHSTAELNKIKVKEQFYKLFNILDECGIEIILLMNQSYLRFIKSEKINKKLLQNLINKGFIASKINVQNNNPPIAFRNAASFSAIKKKRTFVD